MAFVILEKLVASIENFLEAVVAAVHIRREEPRKAVIYTSFRRALIRCRIHVIPASVSITVLILTFQNHYIGTIFDGIIASETLNLLLLQVAAKAQELLIISSLAIVIFHITRTELLFGDGIPLGLIGAGLLFGNLTYFISPEFIGSLRYSGSKWRKARLLFLLIVAGLTAALAGPATAVLIVPRKQQIAAGGTHFYIKGGNNDIWPIELDATATGNLSHCTRSNGTKYAVCPSAGFQSLWSHFGQAEYTTFNTFSITSAFSKPLSGSMLHWYISSPLSLFPRRFAIGNPRSDHTFLIHPHAATAVLLERITTDWWKSLLWKTKRIPDSIDDRYGESTTMNPKAEVRCSQPQNVSSSSNSIEFSTLNGPWRWGPNARFSVDGLNSNASDHLRFQWVHLPDTFGPATIGAVFETAWTADNSSRTVIGCSIHAQWYNGTLFSNQYNFWTGWYTWNTQFATPFPAWETPSLEKPLNSTNGRIAVKDDWLQLLTPPTPTDGPGYFPWKPSTMESIMMNTDLSQPLSSTGESTITSNWEAGESSGTSRTSILESIICSVFIDGVSRAGSHLLYNNLESPDPSQWKLATYKQNPNFETAILSGKDALEEPPQPYVTLKIDFQITGYAFRGTLAGYLSMTVLFVHLIFALGHTIWILSRRKTSDSWDSMAKILLLAQNSKPSYNLLPNTSAGIEKYRTYGRKAKIRATETSEGSGVDHLELIFQDEDEMVPERAEIAMEQEASSFELQMPRSRHSRSISSSSSALATVSAGVSVMTKNSMTSLLRPAGFATSVRVGYTVEDDVRYR